MNFQGLKKIDDAAFYLDVAFRKAKVAASLKRGSLKGKTRQQKSAVIEQSRITSVASTLVKFLKIIIESYPSMDDLPEFYIELIKTRYDIAEIKKSLGSVDWAIDLINKLSAKYQDLKNVDMTKINSRRREFYGRVSSVMKRIDKHLKKLDEARAFLRGLPNVKTSLFTVAISGFPNVGKSTLLTKLTSSTPEIAAYPFTTKGLNMGTFEYKHEKIQLIDTPGTLNRNKENPIETLAYLAMRYCSSVIVFVLDPTYDEKKQKKLLLRLKKSGKPLIIYMSKTDIAEPLEGYDAITDLKKLKRKIIEFF